MSSNRPSTSKARRKEREQSVPQSEPQPHAHSSHGSTACFNCRALRQRCDRQTPCSRCASQSRQCSYPSGTNRGRRSLHKNHSKLSIVNDLLARLNEKSVRDEVVKSLLNSNLPTLEQHALLSESSPTVATRKRGANIDDDQGESEICQLVSPFDAMADAVKSTARQSHEINPLRTAMLRFEKIGQETTGGLVDARLENYFAPQARDNCDWQALQSQPPGSYLKLDPKACDPISACIIDQSDASLYFDLFFKLRNPLLGILDAELHTPCYVYAKSFTLFSVICALGCAVSSRTRDKMLYPVLLDLAEADVKWSMALSVRSLETIQAIMIKQYWAPTPSCHSEDPSWLRLSHAIQVAREMGIHKLAVISSEVEASTSSADDTCLKERIARNFERTWLYIFLADKGFGITIGRHMGVSWREIPASATEWWRKPMTAPTDRILSGVVETRGILLSALAQRKRGDDGTSVFVSEWHRHYFELLEKVRNERCKANEESSSKVTLVMAFYIDHGIMVLNAEAARSLFASGQGATSAGFSAVSQISVKVATRLLNLAFSNEDGLGQFLVGFQNNQLIMICHAATEILQAMRRGTLMDPELSDAAALVRAIPDHLEKAADQLPATCMIHFYLDIARCFSSQAFNILRSLNRSEIDDPMSGITDVVFPPADWWRALEVEPLDPSARFDFGTHGSEKLDYEPYNFTGIGFFE